MIKAEHGEVVVKGFSHVLLSELSGIVRALTENPNGGIDRDDIEFAVNIAFMTDEEKEQMILDKLGEHKDTIGLLKSLVDAYDKATEEMDRRHRSGEVITMDENLMKDVFSEMAMKDGVVND